MLEVKVSYNQFSRYDCFSHIGTNLLDSVHSFLKNHPFVLKIYTFVLYSDILVEGTDFEKPVDIFCVGFEEIVDLNASNIMSAR